MYLNLFKIELGGREGPYCSVFPVSHFSSQCAQCPVELCSLCVVLMGLSATGAPCPTGLANHGIFYS